MTYIKTLLVDMDGPLAGFDNRGWQYITENSWQCDVPTWQDQRHRYFTDHLTVSRERKAARRMTEAEGWFRELPVVEGAIEGIREIIATGVDVWVCTKPMAANPHCADEKRAWIAEHIPELRSKVIITPNKAMIRGDVLLDDAPAPEWIPDAWWKAVIFTQPFNGEGSHWEKYPHWTWGDPLEDLLT